MEAAGQSIASMALEVAGRSKFEVTLVFKNGDKRSFNDSTLHHMGDWLVVSELKDKQWHSPRTSGFRSESIEFYTVVEQ